MNKHLSQGDTHICGDMGLLAIVRKTTEAKPNNGWITLGKMSRVITKTYSIDLRDSYTEAGEIQHFAFRVSSPPTAAKPASQPRV